MNESFVKVPLNGIDLFMGGKGKEPFKIPLKSELLKEGGRKSLIPFVPFIPGGGGIMP